MGNVEFLEDKCPVIVWELSEIILFERNVKDKNPMSKQNKIV